VRVVSAPGKRGVARTRAGRERAGKFHERRGANAAEALSELRQRPRRGEPVRRAVPGEGARAPAKAPS
jgi:hypothetical protein